MLKTTNEMIQIISKASDHYGDKLLEFLERYHLPGLRDATTEQLQEFIITEGFTESKGRCENERQCESSRAL